LFRVSIRVGLVIRHKFQLRFTPKIWHTPGVLQSRDFRRIPSILHWELLELRRRSSSISSLVRLYSTLLRKMQMIYSTSHRKMHHQGELKLS